MTCTPVVLMIFKINVEPRMHTHVTNNAAAYAPATISKFRRSPCASETSNNTVAIVPGPAIIGIASGKTAGFSTSAASRSSSCVRFAPVGRANNISIAIKNSNTPPAIVNAGSVIPE